MWRRGARFPTPVRHCCRGCACSLVFVLSTLAEPPAAAERAVEEVHVFGQREPAPLAISTAAGTHYTIDRGDIERANARSLDEVLELLPGVNIRTGGDGTPRINMRGLRTRQVKILINGIPVNSVGDGNFDPTTIPTEYIKSVEVIPGAGSQLYGDGALAGAINIVTRRGTDGQRADVAAEFGDPGTRRVSGTYSTGWANGDLFVSAGHRSRNAWRLSDDFTPADTEDGDKRLNSDFSRDSIFAALNWRPLEYWEFGLTLDYREGERGVPTSVYDDRGDIFASRPRYERARREDGWTVQASALYEPQTNWRNHAWIYSTNDITETDRFADATFRETRDPTIRNTYSDKTRGRILGAHDILSYESETFGRIAVMLSARQESLSSDCVIQDLPIAQVVDVTTTTTTTTTTTGTSVVANTAPASTYILDYAYTSTNAAGITDDAGGSGTIARLTATNRPGGGIDFRLHNVAASNYGSDSYLKYIYLSPGPTFDLAGLTWAQAIGSEGDIGNINIRADNIDGYDYSLRVNFRRPEQGDALVDGDTASWFFDQGDVNEFFSTPALKTAGLADAYSATTVRRTAANGFWGPAEIQATGGTANDIYNVNLQALSALNPDAFKTVTTTETATEVLEQTTQVLAPNPRVGDLLVDVRLCSAAGGGGGLGLGDNRVERIPSLRFGRRLLSQDRDIEVFSSALEYAFEPWPGTGFVASVGYHYTVRDDGDSEGKPGYSLAGFHDVNANLRVRATASRKVRVPSVNQLYDPDRGNPGLGFEQADSIEGGLDWRTAAGPQVSLSVFAQDVEDFIQTDLISERFENVAELSLRGVEILAQRSDWFGFDVRAGYSYLWSRDKTPGSERVQQQYTPTHRLTASASYALRDAAIFYVAGEYTADQFYYSRTLPLVRAALDDFVVVDANVSIPLAGGRLSLYAGADNLLDENYAESYGIPQAGRFVYAGVKIHLP